MSRLHRALPFLRWTDPITAYPVIIFRYSFASFFPILRLFLPSFSVISCLSLLCFCSPLSAKELGTLENILPHIQDIHYGDAARNLDFVSYLNGPQLRKCRPRVVNDGNWYLQIIQEYVGCSRRFLSISREYSVSSLDDHPRCGSSLDWSSRSIPYALHTAQ